MIIAHRGASATESENTLTAFEAAIAAGADGVEFDVRLTADGHPVVIHDPDVSRTTDAAGLVRSMSLAEVKRLRIRAADGTSVDVPTLDETLALLSGRVFVDIEIKNIPGEPDFDAEGEPAVVATIASMERTGFAGGVVLTSFNPFSLIASRALAPDLATGLLIDADVKPSEALGFAHAQGHSWLLPHKAAALSEGRGFVDEAHGFGMRIGVWLVDDPQEAAGLFASGVDAVATNDPGALIAAGARGPV